MLLKDLKQGLVMLLFVLLGVLIPVKCVEAKTYTMITTGISTEVNAVTNAKKTVKEMTKVNQLWNGSKIYTYSFDYDTDGVKQSKIDFEIRKAFNNSTKKDVCVFYYFGHGDCDSEGNGSGLSLSPGQQYEYTALVKKLGSVKCEKMIVIINACYSGGFIEKGIKSLPVEQRKKFVVFTSNNQKEIGQFMGNDATANYQYAVFTHLLEGGINDIGADFNDDKKITVSELYKYLKLNSKLVLIDRITGIDGDYCYWDFHHPQKYAYNSQYVIATYTYKMNKTKSTLKAGDKLTLSTSVSGVKVENKNVTWKTSIPSVASVSSKGVVTAKKAGKTVITAIYQGVKTKCTITVKPKLSLNKKKVTLYLSGKKTYRLKATLKGSRSKINWKSSNPKVATVNANGKVTAKKTGTVTIKATAGSVSASCIVTIKKKKLDTIRKENILGTWIKREYDSGIVVREYVTGFFADGTVASSGFREKGYGTYKIVNGNKIVATFNENYSFFPGASLQEAYVKDYVYSVTYTYDKKTDTLNAKFSKSFYDAQMSIGNGDGKLLRGGVLY